MTLPVDGDVILRIVCNVDDDSIPFPGIDGWPREPPINCNDWLSMAESAHILHCNLRHKGNERIRSRKFKRVYCCNYPFF